MQHEEENIQMQLFAWARMMEGVHPELALMYHCPNGGRRGKLEAIRLKKAGVKAGVPDICLPVPRNGYNGLYIELKAGKNKASVMQQWWISKLSEQGYKAVVCTGFDAARDALIEYLRF